MRIFGFLFAAIVCVIIVAAPAYAQVFKTPVVKPPKWTARYNREEDEDLGLWPQGQFNFRRGKWMFEQDVNPRLQYRITRLNEFHLREFIGYKVKPWCSVWLGIYPWAPVFEPNYVSETRLLQQVGLEGARGRASYSLRTRLEQRWIEHTNDQTSWRIRFMPRLNYWIDEKQQFYVFTANEVFINFNTINRSIRQGIGQNRLYGGVGFQINPHARLEVAYLNQWLHRRYHVNTLPNRMNHNIVINLVTNF